MNLPSSITEHSKYSREAEPYIRRFLERPGIAGSRINEEEEVQKHRIFQIKTLMEHRLINRRNLPTAIEVSMMKTPGTVLIMANRARSRRKFNRMLKLEQYLNQPREGERRRDSARPR